MLELIEFSAPRIGKMRGPCIPPLYFTADGPTHFNAGAITRFGTMLRYQASFRITIDNKKYADINSLRGFLGSTKKSRWLHIFKEQGEVP